MAGSAEEDALKLQTVQVATPRPRTAERPKPLPPLTEPTYDRGSDAALWLLGALVIGSLAFMVAIAH